MDLHHYLPAAYLGGFSSDQQSLPRRDRKVAAGDRKEKRSFVASAAKLGAERGLYSLQDSTTNPDLIDRTWADYERALADALASLIAGELSARDWVRALVPFVASTLVRGPDFNERFEARIPTDLNSPNNTNHARLFELQRLLGLVAAANWNVLEVPPPGELIVGDVGFAPARSAVTGNLGIAIPLDRSHVLLLEPRQTRHILTLVEGKWRPVINYARLSPDEHIGFSRTIAGYARRFVFGATEDVVGQYLNDPTDSAPEVPEPWLLGFVPPRLARFHEFTWHRLAGFVERSDPDPSRQSFRLDWEALARGWCPPVRLPTNLPEFAPALAVVGMDVVVHFYDIPDPVLDAMMEAVVGSTKKDSE